MEEQQRLLFITSYSVWYDGYIPGTYVHNLIYISPKWKASFAHPTSSFLPFQQHLKSQQIFAFKIFIASQERNFILVLTLVICLLLLTVVTTNRRRDYLSATEFCIMRSYLWDFQYAGSDVISMQSFHIQDH